MERTRLSVRRNSISSLPSSRSPACVPLSTLHSVYRGIRCTQLHVLWSSSVLSVGASDRHTAALHFCLSGYIPNVSTRRYKGKIECYYSAYRYVCLSAEPEK